MILVVLFAVRIVLRAQPLIKVIDLPILILSARVFTRLILELPENSNEAIGIGLWLAFARCQSK